MNAKKIIAAVGKGLKKEWPKIATGLGAGLLVVGGFLAGREVPKYEEELRKKEEEKGEKLVFKEKAKIAVKHFAAPAGTIVAGAGLTVASAIENNKRIGIGTTAAAIGEIATKNLSTYKDAVEEVVSKDDIQKIEDKITEKKLEEQNLAPDLSGAIPEGKVLCYDLKFKMTPFWTDYNTLKAVENECMSRIVGGYGSSISWNEALELLGVEGTETGEVFGWIFDDKTSHREVRFNIGTAIIDGQVVLTINPNFILLDQDFFEKPAYLKY